MRLKLALIIRDERFDGERLGRTGHAFEQCMTFRQQCDQDLLDRIVLSDDYLP